jgi:hypothetical protein
MKNAVKWIATLAVAGLFGACAASPEPENVDETQQDVQSPELNPRHHPVNNEGHSSGGGGGSRQNLTYHGGPVITSAHVVTIFWGSEWTTTAGAARATSINNFVGKYGTSGEYNVITQYSGIQKSSLAVGTWTDTTNAVPKNATDANIQAEASRYIAAHGFDPSAIYEVFLPSTSYSSDGSSTSCGGPSLAYCAYHGNFSSGGNDVRYGSMPYPSCGGCQSTGFSDTQNIEHFISHETREAVTDPDGTAWWDRQGNEADDKCAWSPAPFTDSSVGTNQDGTPFAYQYEWSNANTACEKTR